MTTRAALLIGSPDSKIPGARMDPLNFRALLLSPLGGAWEDDEITVLENPSRQKLTAELRKLKQHDYGFVSFAGHGRHVSTDRGTRIQINPDEEISADDLRLGAEKQTVILDCCRRLEREIIADSAMRKARVYKHALDPADCRRFFDIRIEECQAGLVVLHSCGFNETAGETSRGGWYSRALLDGAGDWEKDRDVNVAVDVLILSVMAAHERASPIVHRESGDRQHPDAEYPRTKMHFPFAIIA
jgi:hypothetical protein